MRGLSEHDRAHGHSEIKALLEFVVFMPWHRTKTLFLLMSRTALFSRRLPPRRHAFAHALSRLAICTEYSSSC